MATCSECEGNRYVLSSSDCERCKGTGEITIYDRLGMPRVQPCLECDHGRIYSEVLCVVCQGTGIV
jgi:DnaJ-class molecular chaperone